MINSKNTNDQYKKRQKFQGNCRSYGKRGHKQRDCWNKEEKQQSSFKENKHSGDGNALTGSLLTSRCDSTTQGDSKNWLLDSCTSHHMTNKRKWFNELEINAQLQENCNIDNFAFYKIDFNLIELENIEICPANEIAENLNEPMNINNENENNENVNVIQENENGLNEMENDVLIENKNENLDQFEHVNYEPRYNLRNHRNLEPPNRGDTVTTFLFDSEEIDAIFLPFSGAPRTYNEAIKSERCDEWKSAMKNEISALNKNNTWTLVNAPPGTKVLSNRWVFKIKNEVNNNKNRFRARLVIKGYL
ncbi:hypothetical protein TKK_0016508 [Trichogramma kaykai]